MTKSPSRAHSLTPQEKLRRDLSQAPTVHAPTKAEVLNAPIGSVIEAPLEVWEELGMDVPDDPSNYL
ncbi:MAG: hypothetical protein F4Z16_06560 [Rhodothermaceae bacterium]|nr:hypothetical protein [Rhodothermaceae bacterium]MYD66854.1 hypothetical protein [Rhodothermaceae bacterium]MYI78150.1 hypothetical protein [Gammaproteobacteria bacterium]